MTDNSENIEITSTAQRRIPNRMPGLHLELQPQTVQLLGKRFCYAAKRKKKTKMLYCIYTVFKLMKKAICKNQKVTYQSVKCCFIKNYG